MNDEIRAIFDEARDGRTYQEIHERLTIEGVGVNYQTTRRWLRGDTLVPLRYLDVVFTVLRMSNNQRDRAIAAARS